MVGDRLDRPEDEPRSWDQPRADLGIARRACNSEENQEMVFRGLQTPLSCIYCCNFHAC